MLYYQNLNNLENILQHAETWPQIKIVGFVAIEIPSENGYVVTLQISYPK